MKKQLTIFMLLLLTMSCTKQVEVSHGEAVKFTASVVDVAESRATLKNSWSGDEEVALFVSGDETIYKMAIAEDGTMTGDDVIVDEYKSVTYTAFYPFDENLTTIEEYEGACTSGNVDFMSAATTINSRVVNLQFSHSLAAMSFTITVIGGVESPAISLALGGDLGSATPLEVEETTGSITSKLEANYFVEEGADISSALLKVVNKGSTTIHLLQREDSNTLEAGKRYLFSYTLGDFADATGTEGDPFVVFTAADMRRVGTGANGWNLDSHYILAGDIDLGGGAFTAIGGYQKEFTGTFDGDGHKVSGLYINKPSYSEQGLFGRISGATIKNLGVSGSVTGETYVAGIVANATKSSKVINCYNECSLTGKGGPFSRVGGVVGVLNENSTLSNCYNKGIISGLLCVGGVVGAADEYSVVSNCYNEGSVSGTEKVGGITGYLEKGAKVIYCYNTAFVSGTNGVGGIVGHNYSDSNVSYCYNIGSIEGTTSKVGGVVGYDTVGATERCSYYDNEVVTGVVGANEGADEGTNCCGLTTEMMKGEAETQGTLLYYFTQGGSTDWVADNENINNGYPILKSNN